MSGQTLNHPQTNLTKRPRWAGLIGLGLVTLALGAWGYGGLVRPNLVPKNFGAVVDGAVYRSGELTPAATRRVVETHKIKTIVDLGAYDHHPELERVAQRTADALSVERHVLRLEGDGRGNPNAYVAALRIIADPAKRPVLVHCSAGSQRTSACIMLYRSYFEGKPFDDTLHEAIAHKHDPGDNTVMRPWLDEHAELIYHALRDGTWIDGQPSALRPELGTPHRAIRHEPLRGVSASERALPEHSNK